MSVIIVVNNAQVVQQVDANAIGGTLAAGENFKATINGKTVNFLTTTTAIADAVAGLLAALRASTIPEFREISWTSDSATTIFGTGPGDGAPFTMTVATDSALGTFVNSTTTASSGPNDPSDVNNYNGAALPTTGDTLIFQQSSVPFKYHLDALAGVQLALLQKFSSMTGDIGLPPVNPSGYTEYRPRYFEVGADVLQSGIGNGQDSGRFYINTGGSACAAEFISTGTSPDNLTPAVLIRNSNGSAAGSIDVRSGSLGLALNGDDQGKVTTVLVGSSARFFSGPNATLTTTTTQGTSSLMGTLNAVNVKGGSANLEHKATLAALDISGFGTANYLSALTCTAVTCGPGTVDCSGDLSARTFTTYTKRTDDGILNDPNHTVTRGTTVIGSLVNSF